MALPASPVIGQKYSFGTLYANGAKQLNPTLPWRTDTTPPGASSNGNIPAYSSGTVEVRDTDATATYQIKWVYVGKKNGHDFYIADRNLLVSVSWDTLNTNGVIFGKTQTLDGVSVKISSLTGGVKDRTSGTTGYNGGTPTSNDWDVYIQNEGGASGLPTPSATDKDSSAVAADFTGAHNQFWNWFYCYTWAQDTYEPNTSYRVLRGYTAPSPLGNPSPSSSSPHIGFRPALEILNSAPLVSDPASDGALGNKAAGFSLSVAVGDADGDFFGVLAKVDTTTVLNLTNQSNGTFTVPITGDTWAGLALGSHTITITVTDTNSNASTRTMTFSKVNQAPTAPTITGLSAGQRLPGAGSVAFTAATDPDGDTLSYSLQFASDSAFTQNVQSFSGSASPISYTGVAVNNERYVRVVASDGNATTASGALLIKIGDKLEFMSLPINRSTMPVSARVLLDATIDPAAALTLYVCNNANDDSPTWENCTSEYGAGTAHVFTNSSKVNASWAVGLRVVVNAGTATGTIGVKAFGFEIIIQ